MLRLHISGSLNDDVVSFREDAIETVYCVSSGPMPYTVVVTDTGTAIKVVESVTEIENALQVWKEGGKKKP